MRVLRSLHAGLCMQDPLFISGTLRENVDPFTEHTNAEVIAALRRVGWFSDEGLGASGAAASQRTSPVPPAAYYRANESPLDDPVADRGANLSAGRQQQIAVARAILCAPRVLLLDEAFASLSSSAASELHAVVREAFTGCSVLQVRSRCSWGDVHTLSRRHSSRLYFLRFQVSHNLATVADSDVVIVLESGAVVERGSPHALLQLVDDVDGRFRGMVDALPWAQRQVIYSTAERLWAARTAPTRSSSSP